MATPSEATQAAADYAAIPGNMQLPVLIHILNQSSGLMATPAELVAGAACFACIEPKMQMPVLISLLASGDIGSGGATTGAGNPEGVLMGGVGEFYWDSVASTLYFKATGTGNTGWIVLLGV
jgi:hypothetical protein